MKNIITFVLVSLLAPSFGFAVTTKIASAANLEVEPIDLDEPPFWMASYDEVTNWRPIQRETYLKGLFPLVKELTPMALVQKKEVEGASESVDGWKNLMMRVYRSCREKKHERTCEKLGDLRVKVLESGSVRAGGTGDPDAVSN